MGKGQKLEYITSFDGIRGLGAVAVIIAHYGYLRCGWIPVQFFFMLSGFLITSILVNAKVKYGGGDYFKTYFWRRALRIFPLYFGYLFLCAVGFALFHIQAPPGTWKSLLTYTHNFYLLAPGHKLSYFFAHLWSLQVEEQFYLLWPFVVFFLGARGLKLTVVGLIVAIPLMRIAYYYAGGGPADPIPSIGTTFYLHTFFQLDAIAIGAAIALFGWITPRVKVWMFIAAAAVMWTAGGINAAVGHSNIEYQNFRLIERGWGLGYPLFMAKNGQYLWGYSMVNFVSALLIIVAAQSNPISKLLQSRPLVYLGQMSYGIYVFHLPVQKIYFDLFHIDPKSTGGMLLWFPMFATVVGISHFSYYYFEKRFLALKDLVSGKPRTLKPELQPS